MEFSFIAIIFLISLPLLLAFFENNKRVKNLPPGPWKLPIIGNLHQLGISRPHVALKELSEKHGPLMHLKLGERSTVVISSYKMLKELIKTSDIAFAHRPELLVSKIVAYNHGDIAFAPYGDYWKQMRKICTSELLSTKRVHSTYPLMEEEISRLVKTIKESSSVEGTPINMYECLNSLTCAIICRASVGTACNDPNSLISAIKRITPLTGLFNISDLFPSLKFLDRYVTGSNQKLLKMHHESCDRLLEEIVRKHEESIRKNLDKEDLLHLLLRLREKESHNFQIPITRDNIKAIVLDMFIGGTDSTSTIMEWAFSELMKNSTAMKKVQFEVRETLKGKKIIDHSDVQNLKYLKLVIKETLRLHPPGPLSLPRESTEQCKVNDYLIPNKTIALVNMYAMGRDPEYWHDPEKFLPDRFNKYVDNDDDVKIKGSSNVPMEFLAFGFGKRVCPGMPFGIASIELTMARLLYHFDWKLPNGMNPEDLDMTENFGAAATKKNNLYLIASPYD